MAHVTADMVKDTATTTGTSAMALSGTAPTGFRTFSAAPMSIGDTCFYSIRHQTLGEWETGLGTYSALNTLTRTTVIASSNAGAAVTFSAGTKDVMLTLLSSKTLQNGISANLTKGFTVTPNAITTGSFTVDPSLGNYQYVTNNGAYTITAPATDCAVDILVTNGATAGATTFTGFTVGANTGSALTTTNTSKFIISIRRINGVSTYSIYALQ